MDQPSRRCESIENKVLSFNKTELDFIRLMMTSSLVDHMLRVRFHKTDDDVKLSGPHAH